MTNKTDDATIGFPLCFPGHRFGVSCGADGPSLGLYKLLIKTGQGLTPRPEAELDAALSFIYGKPVSSAGLLEGLAAAARALNEGQLARAMFVTQHLRLPSLLTDQATRATKAAEQDGPRKAAPDDEKHPGWPKDTPDGKGGQFRPKNGTVASEAGKEVAERATREAVAKKTEKALARRAMWQTLRIAASPGRLRRIALESLGEALPVIDVLDSALLLKELYDITQEFKDLQRQTEIAVEFLKNGPKPFNELRAIPQDESFSSFDAFKKTGPDPRTELEKRFGSAGEGMEWHHIVEQGPNRGVLNDQDLQSTRNIVKLPKALHDIITSDYARTDEIIGTSPRNNLRGKSFDGQYAEGLKKLREMGILRD